MEEAYQPHPMLGSLLVQAEALYATWPLVEAQSI